MTDVMEKDVREIKIRVNGIEKGVDLLLRANRRQILDDLLQFFGRSKDRVKVFLAIDGDRSVGQISALLKMKTPNVSSRITELEREGLVKVKLAGAVKVYEKTEKVEILNLERELKKKFGDLLSKPSSEWLDGGNQDAQERNGRQV